MPSKTELHPEGQKLINRHALVNRQARVRNAEAALKLAQAALADEIARQRIENEDGG